MIRILYMLYICNLQLYEQIKNIWKEVVDAASPYMSQQISSKHFEFYGLDFIANDDSSNITSNSNSNNSNTDRDSGTNTIEINSDNTYVVDNKHQNGTCWLIEINR